MGGIMGEVEKLTGETLVVCEQPEKNPTDTVFKKVLDVFQLSSFRIFPNPTHSGSTIYLEWRKHKGGDFKIQLFSLQGQLVSAKEMSIDTGQEAFEFEIPVVTPGVYIVRLTHRSSGRSQASKIVIQ
jgi:hypothetical protein